MRPRSLRIVSERPQTLQGQRLDGSSDQFAPINASIDLGQVASLFLAQLNLGLYRL
jgi:hypothetical protein